MAISMGTAIAQTATQGERLEFEVASLKPNTSGAQGYSIVPTPGGRLQARNINLKRLVAVAYSVTDFQLFSNMNWFESERFDMDARAAGPAALPQLRLMLRSLLDDRFHIKLHRETREMPVYRLILAKAGTAGPGLVEIPGGDCSAAGTSQSALPDGTPCGVVNAGRGWVKGQRGRISQLCDRLATMLERVVVDQTELKGNYNITATWAPDPELERGAAGRGPGPDAAADGPTLFTALQEQLGLKLVAGKGPVEVIVVDSAEKVTGN
jgi:uncharacterized protein (TIGR03435 family)